MNFTVFKKRIGNCIVKFWGT